MIDRFKQLLGEMNRGIYEKETEISLSLLAALAGESIILLGPPGVAKSMVARQLKTAFREAQSFEYLMSRFSTPDEIFGPVSIQKLKTSDTYERAVEGYLPTADVAFLDEIWKAGPAIQNTLLTVINEKIFRNGNREMHLPLKLLVAASNELPAKGEGLEALWDRFVIRIESRPIKLEKNFRAIAAGAEAAIIPEDTTGSDQLIEFMERGIRKSKKSCIVIVSESPKCGAMYYAERVNKEYPNFDVRVSILGHLQRGGSPSARDRILASQVGVGAIDALVQGQRNVMVGVRNNEVVYVPFIDAVGKRKIMDKKLIKVLDELSI